jgi:hypothetical protein
VAGFSRSFRTFARVAAHRARSAGFELATFTIRVLRSTFVYQDGLVPGLLQCRGEDPPEVTPTAGNQHPHATNNPLQWRSFLDELEVLPGE